VNVPTQEPSGASSPAPSSRLQSRAPSQVCVCESLIPTWSPVYWSTGPMPAALPLRDAPVVHGNGTTHLVRYTKWECVCVHNINTPIRPVCNRPILMSPSMASLVFYIVKHIRLYQWPVENHYIILRAFIFTSRWSTNHNIFQWTLALYCSLLWCLSLLKSQF